MPTVDPRASRPGPAPTPAADRRAPVADQPVIEVMSAPVRTIPADLALGEALRRMLQAGCRHLVVVDRAGRCLGVLADRTIAAAWAYDPTVLSRRAAGTVLDLEPATLDRYARVLDAARLMRTAGVDAVAMVDDDGRPVGILTGGDLIALLAG
ncbi:HPP family protein [Plantactinospora sp. GCM10030261]|uniref:CBS domain-containing protein n=1 Tax=Plantactinospora sp. GCM10030261 TaxID=3273420 RepID=UPI00361F7268